MTGLIEAALGRSRMVLVTLLLLLVAGAVAYSEIPTESDPDVSIGIVYVAMTLDGVSPEDAERLLLRPMEEELRGLEGVKEMSATAYEGGGNVMLEFLAGTDIDEAILDVREAVDRAKPDLPEEADEPVVTEISTSLFPVLVVTLSGEVPERTLVRLARDLRDRIETLPNVLDVDIAGDREEMAEVVIDPLLVESYGLDGNRIIQLFDRSNRLVAAGNLDTGDGRFAVKVPGLLEITKRSGTNVIETIEQVKAVVEGERGFWPAAVHVTFSQDQSQDIRTMLLDLQNNVVSAVVLVMIVTVASLGLRAAGLVGVAIPGSFLTGILVLYALGLTINIVVLFSLILAVGMLVDGATIIVEYADRKMAEGVHRRQAFALAAKRMAWPVISSTATTLAAFLPLLFWPGIVGEFMKYLPITLLTTLAASLVMALIFVPALGAYVGKFGGSGDPRRLKAMAADEDGDLRDIGGMSGAYVRLLAAALRHPAKVVIGAVAVLVGCWYAYATHGSGVEFFPDVEPESAIVLVHARGNLSVEEEDALVAEVEAEVLELAPEFDSVYTRTGSSRGGSDVAEDVIGQITIELADWDRRRPADDILADIRARTAPIAGISVETREPEAGPPVGKPIQIELTSRFPELLEGAAATVREHLEGMGGLVDIEDSRPIPGIEWELAVDRAQAAKFGVDVTAVGDTVKLVTRGLTIGAYRPDDSDDEIDIMVRYPEGERRLGQLDGVRVVTEAGAIPISNFVTIRAQPEVGTLHRIGGQRVVTVAADVAPGVLPDDKVREIRAWLAEASPLDGRIGVGFKGEDQEQKEAEAFLGKAFGVALFLIAIILLTQFNSFYSASLILSAVVMSTVGVLIGLLVTGQPFGIIMTGIGVIALAGIVVSNNIVLIDTFDRLKHTCATPLEAILRTGAQRLRPVLLTTVTTILGVIPMAMSTNIDFVKREVTVGAPSTQWWTSLSTAIAFGLTFATILTLIVTPSALMVRANLAAWRQRRRDAKAPPVEARAVESYAKAAE